MVVETSDVGSKGGWSSDSSGNNKGGGNSKVEGNGKGNGVVVVAVNTIMVENCCVNIGYKG